MSAQVRAFPHYHPSTRSGARLWGIVVGGNEAPAAMQGANVVLHARREHRRARSPHGSEARLRQTVERALRLIPARHVVAVVARDTVPSGQQVLTDLPEVRCIVQPRHRGSAAEIFLPLLGIAREDPGATVVVLPSEHLATRDGRFMLTVEKAVWAAGFRADLLVLVGAASRRPEPTYGWIEPGALVEGLEHLGVRTVRSFVHDRAGAPGGARDGAALGTLALVGRVQTLLALGERHLPEVLETLEPLEPALGGPEEGLLCEAVYECMPHASISRELLERGDPLAVVQVPEAIVTERGDLLAS
jgi:mannose-1-phosphate guanylyltransferase